MDLYPLAILVRVLSEVLIWIVIANALLSYFVSPYHPVRQALDRIVEPLLSPIRRVVPPAGMIDFSPLILIIAIEVLSRILFSLFISL
jgi:YggT family protein